MKPAAKSPRQPAPADASFSAAEIARLDAEKARTEARTPQAILEAFFPAPVQVSGITLREMSLGDIMLLERLESPLAEEDLTSALQDLTASDLAPAVFILSLPFDKASAVHAAGRAAFDDAVLAFASRIPARDLHELGRKVGEALVAAFATVLPMQAEKKTSDPTPASAGA